MDLLVLFSILSLILGLCVGSFLNVVIYRVPLQLQTNWEKSSRDFLGLEDEKPAAERLNIAFPASHCPKCGTPLRAWHNIPVISYLFLRGRCAQCAKPISIQYPLVEITSGLIFLFTPMAFGLTLTGGIVLVFALFLLVLTVIDINTQLLPDIITYPLLWLGLLVNSQGVFTDLQSAVYGAALGYISLWAFYWIFKILSGKEGMGYGDFKLLAALGAWLGWQLLPLVVLLASFLGAVVGVSLILIRGRDRQAPLAFGPYLAASGAIALLWGHQIVSQYLNLFN